MKMEVLLPFCLEDKSIYICILSDATVDDMIGYCLSEYMDSEREPAIPPSLQNINSWQIRIADEGEIDEDFPGKDDLTKLWKELAKCIDMYLINSH